jgi:hypothetical protein
MLLLVLLPVMFARFREQCKPHVVVGDIQPDASERRLNASDAARTREFHATAVKFSTGRAKRPASFYLIFFW